jgi:hypothetical protein
MRKLTMAGRKPTVKLGQRVPDSDIYRDTQSSCRATLVEGEPALPTPKKGSKWRQQVDTNPQKKLT